MKNLIILMLFMFGFGSCIKKDAIKYDPNLVGTWVSNESGIYSWLIIGPDGEGTFSSTENSEGNIKGEVKYSLFEKKLWIGSRKFKVSQWWTGSYDGPDHLETKDFENRLDVIYHVEYKMILKTGAFSSNRSITFYKIAE